MARHYRKRTKEELEPIVKNSNSVSEVIRTLGLVCAGGNYNTINRLLDKYNIDSSHFIGQAHNKGKEIKPFGELTGTTSIKNRLLKEFGNSCQSCGLHTWQDLPIPLELDHIDGNNRNNEKSNLRLLCPNCHALTPTWRNKKRS